MFDIGWSEMLVLAALTIIVVGPKDLPKVMRTVAGFVRKIRSFSNNFMGSIDQMARDAELEELRKNATINSKTPEQIMKEAVDPDEEMADAFRDFKASDKADNLMQQMVDDDLGPLDDDAPVKANEADSQSDKSVKATVKAKKTTTQKKNTAKKPAKKVATKAAAKNTSVPKTTAKKKPAAKKGDKA